jgi:hypothetical protein
VRRFVPLLLASCGRLGFDGGSTADGRGSDSLTGDVGVVVDGDPSRANRMFLTSTGIIGDFGSLAAGDAFCASKATAAGLPGTFLAFLSTSTVDARDRFAGSRGWVRIDGEPVLDRMDDLFLGKLYNPLVLDENNTMADPNVINAWTGTEADGRKAAVTCSDWTNAVLGEAGRNGRIDATIPRVLSGGMSTCANFAYRLYCFEAGYGFTQGPRVVAGRRVFVSTPAGPVSTMAALDAHCQGEANAAALGGTFLAAVATKTASVQDRFIAGLQPWIRPDGTVVAPTFSALFDGSHLQSFVNQRADGTYLVATELVNGAGGGTSIGTTSSTCNDWASTNGAPILGSTGSIRKLALWANDTMGPPTGTCTALPSLLCLEQ